MFLVSGPQWPPVWVVGEVARGSGATGMEWAWTFRFRHLWRATPPGWCWTPAESGALGLVSWPTIGPWSRRRPRTSEPWWGNLPGARSSDAANGPCEQTTHRRFKAEPRGRTLARSASAVSKTTLINRRCRRHWPTWRRGRRASGTFHPCRCSWTCCWWRAWSGRSGALGFASFHPRSLLAARHFQSRPETFLLRQEKQTTQINKQQKKIIPKHNVTESVLPRKSQMKTFLKRRGDLKPCWNTCSSAHTSPYSPHRRRVRLPLCGGRSRRASVTLSQLAKVRYGFEMLLKSTWLTIIFYPLLSRSINSVFVLIERNMQLQELLQYLITDLKARTSIYLFRKKHVERTTLQVGRLLILLCCFSSLLFDSWLLVESVCYTK